MPAVGFHTASQALVMGGVDVYPATTLDATQLPNDALQISTLAGITIFSGSYTFLTRLDGSPFSSLSDAMAYLNEEFSKVIDAGSSGTTQPIPTGYDGGIV